MQETVIIVLKIWLVGMTMAATYFLLSWITSSQYRATTWRRFAQNTTATNILSFVLPVVVWPYFVWTLFTSRKGETSC
jgi:hypothetical protein